MSVEATVRLRVRASAKINLTLRVLGLHPDGYHELRTTFQSLALHDTLTFARRRGPFTLTSDDPLCPTDETNLVWKAAARLAEASGRRSGLSGVEVHIRKRIPMQAGLGGGSSDAAAALRALSILWKTRLDESNLQAIGRSLGADVGFFLTGGTALGVERGDLLFPLADAEPAWVVLARPDFGVSTKEAYAWWDEAFVAAGRPVSTGRGLAGEWVNDLQPPVVQRYPAIAALIRRLTRDGARYAAMSGSGSAVFGIFDDRGGAERACAAMKGRGVAAWATRTLGRRAYLRATAPRAV